MYKEEVNVGEEVTVELSLVRNNSEQSHDTLLHSHLFRS